MVSQADNQKVQALAQDIMRAVNKAFGSRRVIAYKSSPRDIVSDLDTAADRLIVRALKQAFPANLVVTEESSAHKVRDLQNGTSGWLVDPLCGSSNVARGIRWFATNIIRMEGGEVSAAWVVDHSCQRVIWSRGNGAVYVDSKKINRLGTSRPSKRIDVDAGYSYAMPRREQAGYAAFMGMLQVQKEYSLCRLGSSLSFAYVATGQIEGATTVNIYPWDFMASAFLIEQNGGIVTKFDGSPWSMESKSLVMAGDKKVHAHLVREIKACGIAKLR